VILANQFVLDAYGKTASEVVGRLYADVNRNNGLDPAVIERWQNASGRERLNAVEYDLNLLHADGVKRVRKVTANPIQDEKGRLRYIVIIGVDDTERRLAEIRLFDSSRLANLGEMATGMAHEINQPLAVIRMATDSLIEELEASEAGAISAEVAEFIKSKLSRVLSQTERAAGLVRNLRALARKPANDSLPFDLAEAARVGADLLHEQLRAARIEFAVDLPPPGLMVRGEASRLQQVIINLALNARDALLEDPSRSSTGTLGHIALRVATSAAGNAVLTLTDDGPGIPAHILPRLFEPFFTTKPTGKGTGLGLSISYDIIKHMGGEINAENRPEGGARFKVVLPALHEASRDMPTAAGVADGFRPNNQPGFARGDSMRHVRVAGAHAGDD
jgi:PAS domain S-box-containing protein